MSSRYAAYPEYQDSGVTWTGKVPSHWGAKQLKFLCSYNDDVLPESVGADFEIEYIDIGSVDASSGIKKTEKFTFKKAPSRARRRVQDGDVIISTVRTYLEAIASINNPPENMVVSTGFAVIRPREGLDKGFAAYCLRAEGFIGEVVSRSVGISYPAINASDLVNIRVPVLPLPEQKQIAKFLDYETGKIDALIAKQQTLIELLKEKRQAVISHAVTKGLNPEARMKDSGVEWLGDVPEHWEVLPVRHAMRVDNGPRFPINRTERAEMSGPYPYWGPTGILDHIDHYRYEGERVIIGEDGDHFLKFSTWPMTQWATGKFNVNNHGHVVADGAKCSAKWFYYSFLHRDIGGDVIAQGVSRLKLTREGLLQLVLAVPPLKEQAMLIAHMEPVIAKVLEATVAANRQIDLLQERRTALISAAVTGKIDVRDFAPEAQEV